MSLQTTKHKLMVKLIIKAPFARFTQHGEKNDLTTYDIPTPSSLVGLIGSIYGKPEFNWEIRSIEILNKIKRVRMTTNGWKSVDYGADTPDKRAKHTQNARVYLADVAYVVEVEPSIPLYKDNINSMRKGINLVKKHEEILCRYIKRMMVRSGRNVLFLGKNDCPCTVELAPDDIPDGFYKSKNAIFFSIPIVQCFRKVDFPSDKKTMRNVEKLAANGKIFKSRHDGCYYKSEFHHKDLVMEGGKILVDKDWYTVCPKNNSHKNG